MQSSQQQQSVLNFGNSSTSGIPSTTIGIRGLANELIHKIYIIKKQDELYCKAFAQLLNEELMYNPRNYSSSEVEGIQGVALFLLTDPKKNDLDTLQHMIYRMIPSYPKPSINLIMLFREVIAFRTSYDDDD